MGRALALALLILAAPAGISGQTPVVLHIRAVLVDAAGTKTPVARHALLISDNPPTREPRVIYTRVDGTVDVSLRPGNYTVESDQPIAFQGKAYHWTETLNVVAGRDSTLDLTMANARIEPIDAGPANGAAPLTTDPSLSLRPWLDSVVELWTPTAHASGFVVGGDGLIATNQKVVGDATSIEVQLSRTIKVEGTVIHADRDRDVAVIRIDPTAIATVKPVPLGCSSTGTPPAVERGQTIFTLTVPLHHEKDMISGTVSRAYDHVISSEFTLGAGATGGPVFTAAGDLLGLTTLLGDRDERSREALPIVRIGDACTVIAAAATKAKDARAPAGTLLPVEPATTVSIDRFKEEMRHRAGSLKPYQMVTADFDVAFLTPVLNYYAQSQANENFGNWSEYVSDIPPVLLVRVTPKMAERWWGKVARGAAYAQGMALPPIKTMRPGFHRLHAFCGDTEVTPIHPFLIERRVSETDAIHEGLYVFDPSAFGPACGTVKFVLYSEKEPGKGDSRVVDPGILQQIRRDVAPDTNR